jgi:hypothetical protein
MVRELVEQVGTVPSWYCFIEPRNPNGELVELSLIVHRVHDFYVAKMQRQINKLR